jgi:hypothetical protein
MPHPVQRRRLSHASGRASRSPYAAGGAAFVNQTGGGSPYLKIASNASLQMGTTMAGAGWIRFHDIANPNQDILGKKSNTGVGGDEWFLQVNSTTTLRWGFSNGASYQVANWSTPIAALQWYFIYFDWDGANLHVNVNNGTQVTLAATGPINTGNAAVRFGADGSDGTDLNAYLDAWALWKGRVLTAGEQTQLYNGGTAWRFNTVPAGFLTNLVSWWDFDGKSSSLWVDSYGTNDLTDVNNNVTVVTGLS